MLNFPRDFIRLEAAEKGIQLFVVSRIERIQNGLRAFACAVKSGEKSGDASTAAVLRNHIKTAVCPESTELAFIVVAAAGIVQLHGDAETMVFSAEMEQNGRLVDFSLFERQAFSGHRLLKSGACLLHGALPVRHVIQPVIAGTAAERSKELQTRRKRFTDTSCAFDFTAGGGGKLFDISLKAGLGDIDCLVRAEGRTYLKVNFRIGGDLLMPFQRISRIVSRADKGDIGSADQAAHRHVRISTKLFCADIVNAAGIFCGNRLMNVKKALQLQVGPVHHRVPDGHFQRFGKFLNALFTVGVPGNILLRHTVGAHQPPFVVVTENRSVLIPSAEPDLGKIVKTDVFKNVSRGDVAVIIHQRKLFCIVMEKVLRRVCFQKKIPAHKRFAHIRLHIIIYILIIILPLKTA